MSKENIIITVVAIAFFVGFGFLLYKSPSFTSAKPVDPALLVREDSHMIGKMGAKVEFVEFADYECPACAAFNPVVKNVIAEFRDNPDFNYVYRHFPLPQHENAVVAAQAAEAAGLQGKFFEMNDELFANQAVWEKEGDPKPLFIEYAKKLGLNEAKFVADMESKERLDFINRDKADGAKIPVGYTPSFYLNGKLVKFTSELQMKEAIEKALLATE